MPSFLDDRDLDRTQRLALLDAAYGIKHEGKSAGRPMEGKHAAIVMSKPSLRTRVSFTVAIRRLGGDTVEVNARNTKLGAGEDIEEWAAVLGRMVDCIVARTHEHQQVIDFDTHGGVPVVNALTDLLHPCQAVADALTVYEHARKTGFSGDAKAFFDTPQRWAWLGDGNNVTHSLMITAASLGVDLVCACPEGRFPDAAIVSASRALHPNGDDGITITRDAQAALSGANMVYTDTWVSYGQEGDLSREDVERIFSPYRIDAQAMGKAAEGAIFMHCLPAHTGDEVTADVLRGSQSAILDQAENRLWSTIAILSHHVFA